MFIFTATQKRCNPEASYESEDGTRYAKVPRELLTEIPDPVPPADYSEETYYRTEQDEAPYVLYTRKSDEQLQQLANSKIKAQIATLEAGQARAVREAALGQLEYLQSLDAQIQTLRSELK
jgi:succinylglutamate desuccinylase